MTLKLFLILLAVALVLCAAGFYNFVYFMSVGYGFAITGLGVTLMILFHGALTPATIVALILFMLYGLRLSGFLLYREFRNKNYQKVLKTATKSDTTMPIFVKIMIWVVCAFLYVFQVTPVAFRLINGNRSEAILWVGIVLSALGLILETAADLQKSAQKKIRSDMVAMKGLYRFTRCPNYCGEILFWTGVFVGSLNVLETAGQWIMALIGYIGILYVMVSGAARLEKKQNKRYGASPEYQDYVKKTPILLPFLPVYHLAKEKKDV